MGAASAEKGKKNKGMQKDCFPRPGVTQFSDPTKRDENIAGDEHFGGNGH